MPGSAVACPPRAPPNTPADDDAAIFAHGRARLRSYRAVGRELGRGAEAHVRVVLQPATGAHLALKVLPKRGARAGHAFALEARRHWDRTAAACASCDRLPQFVEGFETLAAFYAVMEILPDSLGAVLERRGGLPDREAAGAAAALLDGLAHLHSHGIIHRDVKPANILLRAHGRVDSLCLADLASAFCSSHKGAAPIVPAGAPVAGTPMYLPPEAVRGRAVGTPADVWAAGCVLHEMIFGRTPFEDAGSWGALFALIARAKIDIPDHPAASLMRRLLDPDPSARIVAGEALQDPWVASERQPTPRLAVIGLRDALRWSALVQPCTVAGFRGSGAQVVFESGQLRVVGMESSPNELLPIY
ncbi:kinase-like domain-containing protein [Hyaloraphidium curvatum]|nr:kinase-like domain-containing protein [Hyaloraphidium curvatum]